MQKGTMRITSKRTGYVEIPGVTDDIYIPEENTGTALDGDTVEIKGDKVIRVILRARNEFVCTIGEKGDKTICIADNQKMYLPIEVISRHIGKKALVRITEWKPRVKGTVVLVLGNAGEHETEMKAILYDSGFDARFPKPVEEEVINLTDDVTQEEINMRRDFRNTPTFTIDPKDAKDFDDALSARDFGDGTWEIGIHIADVSHYVREDTLLDTEALRRATSVYLVDRTIPMLPEILSNNICSLVPEKDRLTFSVVFIIENDGNIRSEWFGKSIIHSHRRFTYEDAQKIIDGSESPFTHEIRRLHKISRVLRERRIEKGSLLMDTEEVRFHLDEHGVPISIEKREHTESHELVEEFMLLANKRVAEFVSRAHKGKQFVYRNHDLPSIDRIAELSSFVQRFGYSLAFKNGVVQSRHLNDLIKRFSRKSQKNVVMMGVLRSMAKAAYSTKNIGHFGLAFSHYTHFTSPIRRYPDLMVHRLLYAHLKNLSPQKKAEYEQKCLHASEMEARAMNAERASIKYKQVEYMKSRVGHVFDGIITGITSWGIYTETLHEKCEGMIRLSDLKDDYYELEESGYALVGTRTKKRYQLGDAIKIKVRNADLRTRTIDFVTV